MAVSKSNLQRFLDPLSDLMSIIVRRLLMKNSPDPYAKEFQAALKAKGVTQDEMDKIRGARSTGRIDQLTGDDAQAMSAVFAAFRGDPDVPQKDLKRRFIASLIGPKDAEDLVPDSEDITRKIEAEREQKSEIGTLLTGIPLEVSPRDIHEYHLPVVLSWISGQIESLAKSGQGAEPPQIQEALKHAEEHLGYMSNDKAKKDLVRQATSAIKTAQKQLAQLEENFRRNQEKQKAMEAQANAMQQDSQQGFAALPPGAQAAVAAQAPQLVPPGQQAPQ